MSKLSRIFAGVVLAAGLALALPGAAEAQHCITMAAWYWLARRLGSGLRARPWSRLRRPYYYGAYYRRRRLLRRRRCGWVRTRYWRYGRWHWRRAWRCW